MPMTWVRSSKEKAAHILAKVSTMRDAAVFTPSATEVAFLDLPFYSRYKLLKVTNYATLPSFTMRFLTDETEFIHLDGTATPVYAVNEKDPLQLTPSNVADYIDFFFTHVQGTEGDIFMIKDPQKMPFLDSFDSYQKQSIVNCFKPITVAADDKSTVIRVSGTIYYDGALLAATIGVNQVGRIWFLEQHMLLQGIYFPHSPSAHMWISGD